MQCDAYAEIRDALIAGYIKENSIEELNGTDEEIISTFKEQDKTLFNQYLKKANEDARFVLPNACTTKIVCTFNARSLNNFFDHRCCNRAQWEIREVACQMLELCKEVAPVLFKNSGPRCIRGACPEGKMTCGKMKEVREKYGK